MAQATNPLTKSNDIEKGMKLLETNEYNSILSVSKSYRFYLEDKETLINRPMTQNKKPKLYENGCFWILNIEKFLLKKNRLLEPYNYVIVDEISALDIDSIEDLNLADYYLSKK